jgi:hypothetical protein
MAAMFTAAMVVLAIHAAVALAFGLHGATRLEQGIGTAFTLKPAEIRRGLSELDEALLTRIQTLAGLLLFVVFGSGVAGVWFLSRGSRAGWVFLCVGAGLLVVFAFQILSARGPEDSP